MNITRKLAAAATAAMLTTTGIVTIMTPNVAYAQEEPNGGRDPETGNNEGCRGGGCDGDPQPDPGNDPTPDYIPTPGTCSLTVNGNGQSIIRYGNTQTSGTATMNYYFSGDPVTVNGTPTNSRKDCAQQTAGQAERIICSLHQSDVSSMVFGSTLVTLPALCSARPQQTAPLNPQPRTPSQPPREQVTPVVDTSFNAAVLYPGECLPNDNVAASALLHADALRRNTPLDVDTYKNGNQTAVLATEDFPSFAFPEDLSSQGVDGCDMGHVAVFDTEENIIAACPFGDGGNLSEYWNPETGTYTQWVINAVNGDVTDCPSLPENITTEAVQDPAQCDLSEFATNDIATELSRRILGGEAIDTAPQMCAPVVEQGTLNSQKTVAGMNRSVVAAHTVAASPAPRLQEMPEFSGDDRDYIAPPLGGSINPVGMRP